MLVGAVLVQSGTEGVHWHGIVHKVLIPAVIAPLVGFGGALLLLLALLWMFKWVTPGAGNRGFRLAQLASGTFVAFTHGANDAQKTMGIIALALFTNGHRPTFYVPIWVKLAAGLAIGAGTYIGGWRIMRTLGQRVFEMEPACGFAAQATAGATIYLATHAGYPLSTTHVISGAVMGSGATKRLSAVRWGVAGNIVIAWVLTIPAAALVAARPTGRSRRSSSSSGRLQAVPDAVARLDERVRGGDPVDLVAQAADEDVDGAVAMGLAAAPDRLQQLVAGGDAALAERELVEQPELRGGQVDVLAVDVRLAPPAGRSEAPRSRAAHPAPGPGTARPGARRTGRARRAPSWRRA